MVNKTYTDTISISKTYQVTAINEGITKTSNRVTVNAYYPMYFGEGGEVYAKLAEIDTVNAKNFLQEGLDNYRSKQND